jgi:hypothetical protein
MHCKLTTDDILALYPSLPWLTPIRLAFMGGGPVTEFGCRFCIAQQGLDAAKAETHPKTRDEFDRHMREAHTSSST